MTAPRKLCTHPGCNAYATQGGRCASHQINRAERWAEADRNRMFDPRMAAAAHFRNSVAWHKVRELHKALNPLCCDPFGRHKQRLAVTEESHHIVSLAEDITLGLVLSNLAPLCHDCHATVEGMERSGKDTKYLFACVKINTGY